jgi:hypothetical protein
MSFRDREEMSSDDKIEDSLSNSNCISGNLKNNLLGADNDRLLELAEFTLKEEID